MAREDGSKLRVAVPFGGRSSEHEVSIMSATNVMRALDPAKYETVPIYITRDGIWLLSRFEDGALSRPDSGTEMALVPGGQGRTLTFESSGNVSPGPTIDILFPVLHGLNGEDGSIQGLAEVARVPLAGCGILGSANAIDKDIAKRLLRDAGVPTARSVLIRKGEAASFAAVTATLGLPVFVKPARQGSSVGVSKVRDDAGFASAIDEGLRHDDKLLVEEFVDGREIEFAVLERPDGSLFVSRPGEIAPAQSHGFYSYDAKYVDADGAALIVPAEVPEGIEEQMRAAAALGFTAVGCDGMARVDFFLKVAGSFVLNELNTIPGFTNISMYPKAMEASGIGYAELLDRLIEHGLARAARKG